MTDMADVTTDGSQRVDMAAMDHDDQCISPPTPSIDKGNNDDNSEDTSDADNNDNNNNNITITLKFHNHPIDLTFPSDATISDLSSTVTQDLDIPATHQKFLIAPKPGLLRPPFADPSIPLSTLARSANNKPTKFTLLGTTAAEVSSIESTIASVRARQEARRAALRGAKKIKPYAARDSKKTQDDATYTFATLRPLPHLPRPDKSLRFLERLRDDAGVKAAMRKHRFSVGLLTEMDPAAHTTHEGKTLGLNRNRGEVIELRLRTDAYDGYRDYKTIRRTLAHELAHNVVGPHNAEFHALWNQIEKEIDRNDTSRGGHTLGAEEFYHPADHGSDVDDDADEGGWGAGAYVLGGGGSAGASTTSLAPLNRREAMARAAEARAKQQKDTGSNNSA